MYIGHVRQIRIRFGDDRSAVMLNGSTDLHPSQWDRLLWAFRSLVADFEKKTTRASIKEKKGVDLFLYCAAGADRSLVDFEGPQH